MQEVSGLLNPNGPHFAQMAREAPGREDSAGWASSGVATRSTDRLSLLQTSTSLGFEASMSESPIGGHVSQQQGDVAGSHDVGHFDGRQPQMPTTMAELNPPATDPELLDHESMLWYEQMFAGTLSVIDNPSLAGTGADASLNPAWTYFR